MDTGASYIAKSDQHLLIEKQGSKISHIIRALLTDLAPFS